MNDIKSSLKHDYNIAVRAFNENDFTSFFRNIRPCIELLSKLIVYDILNDEEEAQDLIDGESQIIKGYDNFALSDKRANHQPAGKDFPSMIHKVYFIKHPNVYTSRYDKDKQRLKNGLESCSNEFRRYYDLASGMGSHTGSNRMSESIQAKSCASFFVGYFDFLKSNYILSPGTLNFLDSLDAFKFEDNCANEKAKQQIEQLIKDVNDKDAALLAARAMQAETERNLLSEKEMTSELQIQLEAKDKELDELRQQITTMSTSRIQEDTVAVTETDSVEEVEGSANDYQNHITIKRNAQRLIDVLRGPNAEWDVDEKSMDEDQLDLIDKTIDRSMLVAGCAGSGKSVIAMHKAEQIAAQGGDVILIAYTKSLSRYMRVGGEMTQGYHFYHYHQWKYTHEMPSADYIIVDEIQNFTKEEILEFISAAKKSFFFFGDTAQSIYRQFGKVTLTIEDISSLTELPVLNLYNNYRLPKPVAKITQGYVGVDVMPYNEKVYQNKEKALPHFVYYDTLDSQLEAIGEIVSKNSDKSIGILLPNNKLIIEVFEAVENMDIQCEFKYTKESNEQQEKDYADTLNFRSYLPKVMTYHSAKGLQFDIVILPMFEGARSDESRKSLYVAMTRTLHQLYIMYSTDEIAYPLSNVPSRLYKKQ